MVRKKLAAAIAAIGALQADVVSALGMGDFSLNSALNQPLNAEIRLLNIDDLDESQVLVKMASAADFSKAGVSRDFFLSNIKFNVEVDGKGGGVIRVTTREPVVEPYLNFLVEAHWPSGRMLREFTVLLDLPVFSDNATQAVAKPVSSNAVEPVPAATSVPKTRPSIQQTTARKVQSENLPKSGDEYRVKNDDTLWEIAQNSRPNSNTSVQQTMLGIQQLNPQAFVNGNINRLKAGSVLRLPTSDQISISDRQAIGEVAKHNQAWKLGDSSVVPTADVQLDATVTDASNEGSYGEGARLSIAASGDGDSAGMGEGDGLNAVGESSLNNALAAAQENLDKTSLENQELQSRLGDMEAKLATLQRLIELKDDQLAAMQAGGADYDSDIAIEELSSDQQTAEFIDDNLAVTASEAEQESKATPAATKPPEQGLLDQLKSNPLYAGGAGLLILAIAAVLLMRRRKAQQQALDEQQVDVFDEADIAAFNEFDPSAEEEQAPLVDENDQDDLTEQLVADLENEIAADNADEQAVEAELQSAGAEKATAIESETGDVIAEADIYVAYGRYQQAIDLLRTAAEQEPQRTDIQLKLLEVYVETRDKPAFQQQYRVLEGLGNASAIEQVKEMLSTVDGVSGWLEGMSSGSSAFTDQDMDDDLIEGEADDAALEMDDITLDLDEELDLDLDDLEQESLEPVTESDDDSLPAADEIFDLDDDLSQSNDSGMDEEDAISDETVQLHGADLQDDLDMDSTELSVDENLDLEIPDDDVFDLEDATLGGEFDLDLDEDLDLESLDDADLGELAAEFDNLGDEPEKLTESDDFITDDLVDLGEEFDLDEIAESSTEQDQPSSEELDVELDLNVDEESDATVSYSLDDVTSDIAANDLDEVDSKPQELDNLVEDSDTVSDDDFDFLADTDEVATKLDLARAYIDMGDTEGAKDILDEVLAEGSEQQIQEANALVEKID